MLPRPHRLREAHAIRRVITTGAFCDAPAARIWSLPGATQHTRLACVVGRRVATRAVRRHRYQRLLRHAAAQLLRELPATAGVYDMVWVAKPGIQRYESLDQLIAALTPCLKRLTQPYPPSSHQ